MRVMRRAGAVILALACALAGGARAATAVAGPTPATACPPEPATPTRDEALAAMGRAVDRGLLWKATRDGRTTWLYGTIHVAQAEWMYPGPKVFAAIRASDTIALELDPTDPDIRARLRSAIGQRPGAPDLPPALAARLRERIVAACLPPEALDTLRPEMRAVSIEVLEGRQDGLYPAFGVDTFLAGLARGMNKPLRSLETPESQAALLVSDDPAETERAVAQVLDELDSGKGPAVLRRLAGDWNRGDLDDLLAYASWCGCLDTPERRADFARMVDERNPAMAERIAQWHAEKHALFVAVGSLHLLGPAGLPQLLRERGFDVERVSFGTH